MNTFNLKLKYGTYNNCFFKVNKYRNGNIALGIYNMSDGPICTVTVNPGMALPDDLIAIKNYSENSGVLESLIELGFIEDVVGTLPQGFVEIPICTYNKEMIDNYSEHN